jgi:CubicO group peptidase (beta-lactamase class C family)
MRMRCPHPFAALFVALAGLPAAAQTSTPDPRIDRLFAQWDRPGSPGCAVGVIRDGKLVYERGYGMANLDYDIPSSPRMVYYVGSVSKQFTAAVVGLLALEGKIGLDDDVRKYVPELPDYRARYGVPVTIRHLVHHTSGLRDIYTLMSLAGLRLEDVMTDEAALALIARQQELNFAPGSEFLYSNSGYWLLGQIVERVTGRSLRVVADERIFTPLGMTNTHFHDDPGHVMKNRAMSYEMDGAGGYRIGYLQNFDKIGAGGLYSTVEDLAKWDANYYSHAVGGDALQALIHTRGVLTKGDTIPYAFGNTVDSYRGLRVDDHGGSMMGYKAHLLRFPDQRLSVIETCNLGSINPGPIARQVAELFIGDRMAPAAPGPAPAGVRAAGTTPVPRTLGDVGRIVGTWHSEELDATYRILYDSGKVLLRRPNVRDVPLELTNQLHFTWRAAGDAQSGAVTLQFEPNREGKPAWFTVEAGRVTHILFRRR